MTPNSPWEPSHRDLLLRTDDSEPPEGMEDALFARVQAAVRATGPESPSSADAPAPQSPSTLQPLASSAAPVWVKPVIAAASVAFIAGIATGVGAAQLWPRAKRPAEQASAPAVVPSAPPSHPATAAEPVPAPAQQQAAEKNVRSHRTALPSSTEPHPTALPSSTEPHPTALASSTEPHSTALASDGEYELVERARTALLRGELSLARDALALHAQRFPEGELTEEREALEIQVALGTGDPDLARTQLERFHARHPKSLLLPALRREVERR